MLKQLTRAELSRALSGLSLDEKRELLKLLEVREERRPERVADDRQMWRAFPMGGSLKELEDYIREAGENPATLKDGAVANRLCEEFERDRAAEQSADPESFKRAWDDRRAAYDRHFARLEAEHPEPAAPAARIGWFQTLFIQAGDLADAEVPLPQAKAPATEPVPADPLDTTKRAATRRAPLARDELLDQVLGQTEEAEARRRAERSQAADVPEPEDKLSAYRDKSPSTQPPHWPDS